MLIYTHTHTHMHTHTHIHTHAHTDFSGRKDGKKRQFYKMKMNKNID